MERTERVSTSLTPENKQRLRTLAARNDMTMSEYVRMVLLERLDAAEGEGNLTPTPMMASS